MQKEEIYVVFAIVLGYDVKLSFFPYEEFPIYEFLSKITRCTDIPDEKPKMMILINNKSVFGAATVFYPNVLKELAEKHGTSLFLLPSSIHEFLVLEDNGIYRPEELKDMVQEAIKI